MYKKLSHFISSWAQALDVDGALERSAKILSPRKTAFILAIILLAALCLRLGIAFQLSAHPVVMMSPEMERGYDQWEWNHLAWRIASEGDWLLRNGAWEGKHFFHYAPGYVYFLAVIFSLFGHSYFAVALAQAFLGVILVLIVFLIAREMFDSIVGLAAAALAAGYDLFILYEQLLLRDYFATVIFAVVFLVTVRARNTKKILPWLGAGMCAGLSNVAKPNIFLPLILAWLFVSSLRAYGWKAACMKCAAVIAGCALVIMPVSIYNFLGGEPSLVCMQGSRSFWIGNAPGGDGFGIGGTYKNASVLNQNSHGTLKNVAIIFADCLKRFPKFYRELYARKWKMFWNAFEIPSSVSLALFKQYPSALHYVPVTAGVVLPLALVGIVLSLLSRKRSGLLYLFVFGYAFSLMLFMIQARYRMPIMPIMIVFAAVPLVVLWQLLVRRNKLRLMLVTTLLMAAMFFTHTDSTCGNAFDSAFFYKGIPWWQYANFAHATRAAFLGRQATARISDTHRDILITLSMEYLERAIKNAPNTPILYFRLGEFHEMRQEFFEAMVCYQRYLLGDPANKAVREKIGYLQTMFQKSSPVLN